jgi:hypothetical protein
VIGDNLEGREERHGQEGARDAPEIQPLELPDDNRHVIQLQALPIEEGNNHVVFIFLYY